MRKLLPALLATLAMLVFAPAALAQEGPSYGEILQKYDEAEGPSPQSVDIGITSYTGDGLDSVAGLDSLYGSQRYEGFEARLRKAAEERGSRLASSQNVVGVFEGDLEPSQSVELSGDPRAIRWLEVCVGQRYDQESVLEFRAAPEGPDALHVLQGISDPGRAVELLEENGLAGGTIEGENLEVASMDNADADKIQALAGDLGVEDRVERGHVEFVSVDDYECVKPPESATQTPDTGGPALLMPASAGMALLGAGALGLAGLRRRML